MTDEREPFVLPAVPKDFFVQTSGQVTQLNDPDPEQPYLQPPETPPFLEGRVKHFSASSLRMLKLCPEQYRQRYILGKKERPQDRLTLGTATHSAMAFNYRDKIESHEDKKTSEVVEYFHDKAWPDAVEKDGGKSEIRWDTDPDDVRRDGERMTQAYHADVCPRVQPVELPEQKITLHVEGLPVPVIGYLDVVEEANIIDLKTGKQVQRKPDANWRMQGAIYSLATGKPAHFHSLSRAKTPSIATPLTDPEMALPFQEELAQTTRAILVDYAAQVEWFFNRYGPDDPWPTTGVVMDLRGGLACNYCGFRKDCPAWAWERKIDEDALRVALEQSVQQP